jgi:integrase/recombinase XerD
MNSRQGIRYIKNRMGNDLKEKILTYNGIDIETNTKNQKTVVDCPRCQLVNALENKYCSKCSYPLKPEAYDELKEKEEKRIDSLEKQITMLNDSYQEIINCLKYPDAINNIILSEK